MKHTSDYFTGGELLDELGILAGDLVRGIRRGIVPKPISETGGQFRTPETDPALYNSALCSSDAEWLALVRGAKFFKPFVQVAMPRIMSELVVCWENDEQPSTLQSGQDQQADGCKRPLPTDEATDFIQRLRDKKVHPDEIQYRVYEYRLPRWGLSQWKAHCLVNDIDYPPKGLKGDPDRDKCGKAYRDARDRHLARARASEKSEFTPEKSEFMT